MAIQTLLRLPKVEAATGYKRSTIYKKIKDGTFPAPIALGERASAWLASEIDTWIQSRIEYSRKTAGHAPKETLAAPHRTGAFQKRRGQGEKSKQVAERVP